jgi:ketosteroid isomerase-like protein
MRKRDHAAVAVLLAAALIAGCGGGGESDEDQVRGVVESFVQAGEDRDAAAACDLLAADQVKTVEKIGPGGSCATILAGIFSKAEDVSTDVEIQDVRVEGDRATVDATVKSPGSQPKAESILVVREDGEWKLASVGL